MARQKQVFARDELAHKWAHKAQDSGRDTSGNMFFTGPTLYSYGSHYVIAHILSDECGPELAGRVLWNTDGYSNTTGTHRSYAWRALTRQQKETCIDVPGMNETTARMIDRALREKTLPAEYVAKLCNSIREHISATEGKRAGSGPFIVCFRKARQVETVARILYARAKRKYPLPLVPADTDIPTDKTERATLVLSFSKPIFERDYKAAIANATRGIVALQDAGLSENIGRSAWDKRQSAADALRRAESCSSELHSAQRFYGAMHAGKKSAAVSRMLKTLAPILTAARERKDAADNAYFLEDAKERIGRCLLDIRKTKSSTSIFRMPEIADNLRRSAPEHWLTPLAARLALKYKAMQRELTASGIAYTLKNADSYYDAGHYSDARRDYRDAIRDYENVTRFLKPAHAMYLLRHVAPGLTIAAHKLADIDARIAQENADKITAWISGASNVRPHRDAGTFARINGAVIETTHGASVPIEHGCRLARLYAIAVRKGGANWPDGAGPMVGHYRVNSIGVDGSLVIGCHEFNTQEAQRLYVLLSACPECSEETESVGG
jgi:hypothetical protein